jgi:hypothetical protein
MNKKHSKNTVPIDVAPKDCNNRRNRMHPSKIKKGVSLVWAAVFRQVFIALQDEKTYR